MVQIAAAALALSALPAARAADMAVSGQVPSIMGISVDTEAQTGTEAVEVTRERRGDLVIVTVYPR